MLSTSYAELQQIKSQISGVDNIFNVKDLLKKHEAIMTVGLSSPSACMLHWDVLTNTFTGNIELYLEPILKKGEDSLEIPRVLTTIRAEDPNSLSFEDIQKHILRNLQSAL